jgi:hypothetical protein
LFPQPYRYHFVTEPFPLPLSIAMGFMIVMISVIIGAFNAGNATTYYAIDKATREASVELAQLRASIESISIWLPHFKFLGVSTILGIVNGLHAIVFALRYQRTAKSLCPTPGGGSLDGVVIV